MPHLSLSIIASSSPILFSANLRRAKSCASLRYCRRTTLAQVRKPGLGFTVSTRMSTPIVLSNLDRTFILDYVRISTINYVILEADLRKTGCGTVFP